jgi:hypothetical protein
MMGGAEKKTAAAWGSRTGDVAGLAWILGSSPRMTQEEWNDDRRNGASFRAAE